MSAPSSGKVWLFDLETSSLDANRGHIMCAAGKWLGEEHVYTWNITDVEGFGTTPESFYNDGPIVEELVEKCNESEAVVAYFGDYGRFDVPYLNTRAMSHGLTPCKPLTVIDPHKTARRSLKLARNTMDAVATLLKCNSKKYHLPWEDWRVAQYGDKKAMAKLLEYCVNDVLVLEELYTKLRPLIKNHPYVGEPTTPEQRRRQCPACGSLRTKGHGYRHTKLYRVRYRQCHDCGTTFEVNRERIAA